eukprot:1192246-Prorocentrum_minimum.AAC.3
MAVLSPTQGQTAVDELYFSDAEKPMDLVVMGTKEVGLHTVNKPLLSRLVTRGIIQFSHSH